MLTFLKKNYRPWNLRSLKLVSCTMTILYFIICSIFFLISETFVESIPQTHISCISLAAGIIESFSNHNVTYEDYKRGVVFLTSFVLSVIATSYGMSNFWMNGPAKLVQKLGPLLLVAFANAGCLIGKAFWLANMTVNGPSRQNNVYIFAWLGLSIVPNMILVSLYLLVESNLPINFTFAAIITFSIPLRLQNDS